MIVINNKLVEIPVKFRGELMKMIGEGKKIKFPKRFVRTVPIYSPSGSSTGRYAQETPMVRSFPLSAYTMLDMNPQSENYLKPTKSGEYCLVEIGQRIKTENGTTSVTSVERFSKPRVLKNQDYELFWFLYYICPYVENGKGAKPGGVFHFEIEDKDTDARVKNEARKVRAKVEHLLSGDEAETGLTDKKIIELAYIYGVSNPQKLGRELLCETILNRVEKDEKTREYSEGDDEKGYAFFAKILTDMNEFKYRAVSQKAIDNEILGFDSNSQSWRYIADKHVIGTPAYFGNLIVKKGPNQKPMSALVEHVRKDSSTFNYLESVVTGQVPVASLGVASPLEEMTDTEKKVAFAKQLEQSKNFAAAYQIYTELKEEDKANKQSHTLNANRLKKFMPKEEA